LRNFESDQFQGMLQALLTESSGGNEPVSVPK
jgi:hypothetical protein